MRLERVEQRDIGDIWPGIASFVSNACERSNGRYAAEHVRGFLSRGVWQLWVVRDDEGQFVFVGTTEIVSYPTGLTALHWHIGTGKCRESWQHMMGDILSAAKGIGCEVAEGLFRPGWRRVFSDWTVTHVSMEKRL